MTEARLRPGDRVRPIRTSDLLAPFAGQLGRVTAVEPASDGTLYVWVTFDGGGYASHVPAGEFVRLTA